LKFHPLIIELCDRIKKAPSKEKDFLTQGLIGMWAGTVSNLNLNYFLKFSRKLGIINTVKLILSLLRDYGREFKKTINK